MSYRGEIIAAARVENLDPDLVQAVVGQESGYKFYAYRFEAAFFTRYLASKPEYASRDPWEVSASYGLMQVMYPTAVDLGYKGDPWGLFAPAESLRWGCKLLGQNFNWASKLYNGVAEKAEVVVRTSALAAYNGGRGGNAPDDILDRNHAYADEVMARYRHIRGD